MRIVNLPEALALEGSSPYKVYDYETSQECSNQMVSLNQNTFSFLIEGSKEVVFDKTAIAIENSNFLLMKAGNCLMTERLPSMADNYRSILFFFPDESLIEFVQKHKIKSVKSIRPVSTYSFQYDNFLKTFAHGLIDISKLNTETQAKLLVLKFEELMLYLKETQGIDFITSLVAKINNQSQHFIETVVSNKLNKLSLKELAFLSNMSLSTFKREFEKHFHSSPSKWFQDQRLEHAAYLLKRKLKRPSDIFEEIGYENLSNFTQAFKTKFGITPKQYQ